MEQEENKTKRGRKLNVAGAEERLVEAMNMVLYEKFSYNEFRAEGAKRFGITERQAEYIYKDVKERIKARFTEQTEEIINDQLYRYFDLLQRCRENGNKRVEREVLQDLSKLYGLDVKKVDVTSGGAPISININLAD